MSSKSKKKTTTEYTSTLLSLADDVDLVRFETNLLQIGFFSSSDNRSSSEQNKAWRRIEMGLNRDGQRIKVAVEFQSSEKLGLPSTSDRDKYLALMKIVNEQKLNGGRIQNPIRFSGYRLLKELGFADAGSNYEDLLSWGRRMTATTITSEKVIYNAARKRYSDRTVHVFNSFERVGESAADGSGRVETYEVELADWLLENLNQSYVIPEDFRAYKQLKRPTAKGIFGNLHLWFHASQGRPVEKDYAELCSFLDIRAYPHASKIKETMGASLNELMTIGYLASWDLVPMVTKKGFKIVISPGLDLLRVIGASQKSLPAQAKSSTELTEVQKRVYDLLVDQGVLPQKALELVRKYDPERIEDLVEFAKTNFGKPRINNPAGLLIYNIENEFMVPSDFMTTRKHKRLQEELATKERELHQAYEIEMRYRKWVDEQVENDVASRYSQDDLQKLIGETIKDRLANDKNWHSMRGNRAALESTARQVIYKEIRSELTLPTLEEWSKANSQGELFSRDYASRP